MKATWSELCTYEGENWYWRKAGKGFDISCDDGERIANVDCHLTKRQASRIAEVMAITFKHGVFVGKCQKVQEIRKALGL